MIDQTALKNNLASAFMGAAISGMLPFIVSTSKQYVLHGNAAKASDIVNEIKGSYGHEVSVEEIQRILNDLQGKSSPPDITDTVQ